MNDTYEFSDTKAVDVWREIIDLRKEMFNDTVSVFCLPSSVCNSEITTYDEIIYAGSKLNTY